ncbi:hypothetical protein GIB67_033551 [Kingdonia uniflora]|uniref:SAC domain-containing protein n=1 Tax=Kingdonia uniflora TaxID=39325 RepID=A0A7J7L6B2_9MAGN|nr:hypothetical protein GIB67_033551 [Kingdonia uniflora]
MNSSMLQKGVLKTNCIDCLDRTNVAQYAYGLVALGYKLLVLGFIDILKVNLDAPLANDLMRLYEKMADTTLVQKKLDNPAMPKMTDRVCSKGLSDYTPEISTCESDLSYSRYTPTMTRRQLFTEMQSNLVYFNEDTSNCSNFVDLEWLSSLGNSCKEESYEKSVLLNSLVVGTSTENVVNGIMVKITSTPSEDGSNIMEKGQT